MESRILTKSNLIINKDIGVGLVIFVVEGEKTEFEIIENIFTKVFSYTIITKKRFENEPITFYEDEKFPNSKIVILNSSNSSLSSVRTGADYLDNIYRTLNFKYNIDCENAAIYYIFDRDRFSNSPLLIKSLLNELGNSRDNGINPNGLLLLSYPSVESLLISYKEENVLNKKLYTKIKEYIYNNKYYPNTVNLEQVVNATLEMIKAIEDKSNKPFNTSIIDNFISTNLTVFRSQESHYSALDRYQLISLFTIAFMDLNLITIQL
ncbi:MAG: hypothetical protein LBM99_05865 [Bacillales bacterium]|jgi:hypothetical protein|nr:hypothetical protein [Bacillales bacterium]